MARTLSSFNFNPGRVTCLAVLLAATALPLLGQTVESGDLMLVERPQADSNCPAVCSSEITVQSPPGSGGFVIGSQIDGAPSQIFEGVDGSVWFAHSPRQGVSRVEALINSEGNPVREGTAPVLFAGTPDAQVTAAVMAADGTLWVGVDTGGGSTLFRRGPDARIVSELRGLGPIRSIQLAPDQCNIYWLSGQSLMSYDACFKFGPNQIRSFTEEKFDLVLLPDGGYFVTGSGPVLQFNAAGQQVRSFAIADSEGRAETLALTPDASQYWVGTTDGILRRFDFRLNQALQTAHLIGRGVSEIGVRFGWSSALDGPVPVTDLLLAGLGGTAIDLRWSHRARKATGYEVEGWTDPTGWVLMAETGPDDHVRISGLSPDTDYIFRVRTVTPWGVSAWSNLVMVRTGTDPVPPTRFRRGVRPPR